MLRCGALMRPTGESERDADRRAGGERRAQRRRGAASGRRRARGAGRGGDRSGRLHARAWRRPPSATAPSCAPAFRVEARGARDGEASPCPRRAGESLRCRGGRSTAPGSAPARWRASPATSRSRSTRARASSWSSTRRAASRSSGSCSPSPARRTKGVLVFPTIDGKVVAGPTAVDQEDPERLVRPSQAPATRSCPRRPPSTRPLADAEPIAAYAGLRPAGRGVNYLIRPSDACPGARQRGGDPLHRPDGVAGDRRARLRDRRRARRGARRPGPLEPGSPSSVAGPVVAPNGRAPGVTGPSRERR